jgi:hypothetical protein
VGVIPVGLDGVKGGFVTSADFLKGLPEAVGHPLRHDLPAVLGGEDDVGMKLVDHMTTGAEIICSHMPIIDTDQ